MTTFTEKNWQQIHLQIGCCQRRCHVFKDDKDVAWDVTWEMFEAQPFTEKLTIQPSNHVFCSLQASGIFTGDAWSFGDSEWTCNYVHPKIWEDEPILTSIFFNWAETTNQKTF